MTLMLVIGLDCRGIGIPVQGGIKLFDSTLGEVFAKTILIFTVTIKVIRHDHRIYWCCAGGPHSSPPHKAKHHDRFRLDIH